MNKENEIYCFTENLQNYADIMIFGMLFSIIPITFLPIFSTLKKCCSCTLLGLCTIISYFFLLKFIANYRIVIIVIFIMNQYWFYKEFSCKKLNECYKRSICYFAGFLTIYMGIWLGVMRKIFKESFYSVFPFYYYYTEMILSNNAGV